MRFSILIPSWNNLPFLKLCVESLRKNSSCKDHQIIVHVNDGSDGTLDWVRAQGLDYTHSPENIGVCLAMNMMRRKVKTDYILYMNDDMYALPGWDEPLAREVESLPDNLFYLSTSLIQPHTRGNNVILADYGDSVENFREKELLEHFRELPFRDWAGSTWPACLVHRDIWDLAGGYSVELTPGMYSDPDFSAKLWLCGVRYFKGLADSRIYHFETKSTTRIVKNPGSNQFLMKWGMTNRAFSSCFLHKHSDFDPEAKVDRRKLARELLRCRLKAVFVAMKGLYSPLLRGGLSDDR